MPLLTDFFFKITGVHLLEMSKKSGDEKVLLKVAGGKWSDGKIFSL